MPTECSRDLFGFAPVEGREVVAAFDGGAITSDAGALLLGATDRATGTASDVAAAFATLVEQQVGALLIGSDIFFGNGARNQIISLAARYAVPTMFFASEDVAAGGLASYSPPKEDEFHQVGLYVGRILKGEKPADLPVVQPTRFEFVINLRTARALGLEIPPLPLALTDKVIE